LAWQFIDIAQVDDIDLFGTGRIGKAEILCGNCVASLPVSHLDAVLWPLIDLL
jgi:hypothetical protein